MELKIHSIVSLITNSSTVLYTDSRESVNAVKDVIREIFKLHNVDKKVEDIFAISLEMNNFEEAVYDYISDNYEDFGITYNDELDEPYEYISKKSDELAAKYLEDIESGKIEKFDWMNDVFNVFRINLFIVIT
jgi:Ran GTPase-activating protein (RanGAP) involved in mRNA processing and transport